MRVFFPLPAVSQRLYGLKQSLLTRAVEEHVGQVFNDRERLELGGDIIMDVELLQRDGAVLVHPESCRCHVSVPCGIDPRPIRAMSYQFKFELRE